MDTDFVLCEVKIEMLYCTYVFAWPRGLRHGSAAVGLLGLGFESCLGHGVYVACEQVEVSATD
jgi:hypothetical protein